MKMYSISDTTDASGYCTFTTDVDINTGVAASPNNPQSGAGAGLVSAVPEQTGTRQVKTRFWRTESGPDSGSVLAAGSEHVNYTLIVS
jgi:hypothetical protein